MLSIFAIQPVAHALEQETCLIQKHMADARYEYWRAARAKGIEEHIIYRDEYRGMLAARNCADLKAFYLPGASDSAQKAKKKNRKK